MSQSAYVMDASNLGQATLGGDAREGKPLEHRHIRAAPPVDAFQTSSFSWGAPIFIVKVCHYVDQIDSPLSSILRIQVS